MARNEIRIDDLAHPRLDEAQRAAIEAAGRASLPLREDAVMEAARRQTGLADFGDEGFRVRLREWLASADEDRGLNSMGRATVFGNAVRALSNRLRVEDLLRRRPEILDVELRRPIVIAGLPRSGTTHLVNLVSADDRLRSMPYWESLEPVPDPAERPGPDGEDPRIARCRAMHERVDRLLPHLRAMHHMTPEHVHEEIELQELDFCTYGIEWYARVPRWRDFYLSCDARPSYTYLKRVLQVLTWLRGPNRWVLKSPQHLERLPELVETFPDATVVLTHRDPVHVIQSATTMVAYGSRLRRDRIDLADVAEYWTDRIERLLRACVRDRDRLAPDRSVDVLFHEFMADDVATVERIYRAAGLPMTEAARARLDAFLAANPRGRHGRVVYDLRRDFGLDPAELRRRFAFYFDRFAVRAEEDDD
ncbi:sulfotransferase [bacterium]|nr:sulfotransferase [bacterium]